jgi:cycloartenol synthase
MWKFTTASDSDGHPLLRSLNGNIGRQVWEYDANAGTPEERAHVERLREQFTANRLTQKHSSDELLR